MAGSKKYELGALVNLKKFTKTFAQDLAHNGARDIIEKNIYILVYGHTYNQILL